jgi:hypothetical protein
LLRQRLRRDANAHASRLATRVVLHLQLDGRSLAASSQKAMLPASGLS